jgi:hypothetical protein
LDYSKLYDKKTRVLTVGEGTHGDPKTTAEFTKALKDMEKLPPSERPKMVGFEFLPHDGATSEGGDYLRHVKPALAKLDDDGLKAFKSYMSDAKGGPDSQSGKDLASALERSIAAKGASPEKAKDEASKLMKDLELARGEREKLVSGLAPGFGEGAAGVKAATEYVEVAEKAEQLGMKVVPLSPISGDENAHFFPPERLEGGVPNPAAKGRPDHMASDPEGAALLKRFADSHTPDGKLRDEMKSYFGKSGLDSEATMRAYERAKETGFPFDKVLAHPEKADDLYSSWFANYHADAIAKELQGDSTSRAIAFMGAGHFGHGVADPLGKKTVNDVLDEKHIGSKIISLSGSKTLSRAEFDRKQKDEDARKDYHWRSGPLGTEAARLAGLNHTRFAYRYHWHSHQPTDTDWVVHLPE